MITEKPPDVPLYTKYHFSASFGVTVTVQLAPGDPENNSTRLRPSLAVPSVIASEWVDPVSVTETAPSRAVSISSVPLEFQSDPQVLLFSPVAGRIIPLLEV